LSEDLSDITSRHLVSSLTVLIGETSSCFTLVIEIATSWAC